MGKKSILLTLGAGYICTQISKVNRVEIKEDLGVCEDKSKNENIGVFITDKGLCDSMILMQINKGNNKINVVSFLKSCYVNDKKIGRVYNQVGPVKTIKFLNETFELAINNYVRLDYKIIEKMIDKVSGIEMDMAIDEVKENCYKELGDGMYLLTGREAIDYLKSKPLRRESKAHKQKRVVKMITDKLMSVAPGELFAMISEGVPQVETSLKTRELVGLGISCLKIGMDNINKNKFPLKEDLKKVWIQNEIGVQCDLINTRKQIHDFLDGKMKEF
ncbi:MAG: LCP family protein [Clostridium sp.]